MDWTLWGDMVFMAGGLCSLALFVWGGWLCIPLVENVRYASSDPRGKKVRDPERTALPTGFCVLPFVVLLAAPGEVFAEDALERGINAYHETKYEHALDEFRICSLLRGCAKSFVADAAQAQSGKGACAGTRAHAHTAYLILDQSEKSEAFRVAMKSVSRPDLVAMNFVRGDFSKAGPNAERHPLVYVFEGTGDSRKIDDPAEFVRIVNQLSACARS